MSYIEYNMKSLTKRFHAIDENTQMCVKIINKFINLKF